MYLAFAGILMMFFFIFFYFTDCHWKIEEEILLFIFIPKNIILCLMSRS